MIEIAELIKKLEDIKEWYPNVPVDVDKIVVHVSIEQHEYPVYLTLEKVSVCS
jgi:hypothetical protein